MENTNTVNNVNISLSEFNIMKSNLDASRDLLAKTTAELNVLRNKVTDNKLIVIEKRKGNEYSGTKTVQTLELNVKDPEVSKVLLDVISEVETSELSNKILEKESEIKNLESQLNENRATIEAIEREKRFEIRKISDNHSEEIRRLTKGYKDSIDELEEDKETLQKSLKDLKLNKTQEQIEIAHEEEISKLKDKLECLEKINDKISAFDLSIKGFFGFKKYLTDLKNARKFKEENVWVRNLWSNTMTALERVQIFSNIMKSVGKIDKKEVKQQPVAVCNPYATRANGYSVYGTPCVAY